MRSQLNVSFWYFNFIFRCCRERLAGIQASRWPRWWGTRGVTRLKAMASSASNPPMISPRLSRRWTVRWTTFALPLETPLVSRSICGFETNQAEQVQLERQKCGCSEREAAPEEEDGLQILNDYPFVGTASSVAEQMYLFFSLSVVHVTCVKVNVSDSKGD